MTLTAWCGCRAAIFSNSGWACAGAVEGVDMPTAAERIVITITMLNSNQPKYEGRVITDVFFTGFSSQCRSKAIGLSRLPIQIKLQTLTKNRPHPFQLTLDMELETGLTGTRANNALIKTGTYCKILSEKDIWKG
jgi:hypothetical protein